jgi:hypothetical protein
MSKYAQLEKLILADLHAGKDPSKDSEVKSELKDLKLTESKLEEIISNHFYLAPRNIKQAQLFLGLLVVVVAMALAAVRIGNDYLIMFLITALGVLLGLPYMLFYYLFGGLQDMERTLQLARLSFVYTVILSISFTLLCVLLNLLGVVLIPLLMVVLFFSELHKLSTLLKSWRELNG